MPFCVQDFEIFVVLLFETGAHCVSIPGLELSLETNFPAKPQRHTCLCLSIAGIERNMLPCPMENSFFQLNLKLQWSVIALLLCLLSELP